MNEFDEYIASQYLAQYDLEELVEVVDEVDKPSVFNVLITYNYNTITPEEILSMMDEDELNMLFASEER